MTAPLRLADHQRFKERLCADEGRAKGWDPEQGAREGTRGGTSEGENTDKKAKLAALDAHIRRIEDRDPKPFERFDDPLDAPLTPKPTSEPQPRTDKSDFISLTEDGLLHSFVSDRVIDYAAASRALLALLRDDDDRPILWVIAPAITGEYGLPYGPGLAEVGIDPARILLVRPKTMADALWAVEEGLSSNALSACIGDGVTPDLTQSRRLSLATRQHQTPCLLLSPRPTPAGAAYSQWCVTATQSRGPSRGPSRDQDHIRASTSSAAPMVGARPVVGAPAVGAAVVGAAVVGAAQLDATLTRKRSNPKHKPEHTDARPSSTDQLALPLSMALEDPNRDPLFPLMPASPEVEPQKVELKSGPKVERNHDRTPATHHLHQLTLLGQRTPPAPPKARLRLAV